MFETLFSSHAAFQRHSKGPLASERTAYLDKIAARGAAHGTLLRKARYCLCVAKVVEKFHPQHCFSLAELDEIASSWARERVTIGRAGDFRWPKEHFRSVATEFLKSLDRLLPEPTPSPSPYCDQVEDFIAVQHQKSWLSSATCYNGRWHILKFLSHLKDQGHSLENIHAGHIDTYFQHVGQKWSRTSLHTSAKFLRAWFRHCEDRGWVRPGLSDAIILPRIYLHEGIPLGPTWSLVVRAISESDGDSPSQLRNRAILLLLSIYALRSGEVRHLQIDNIDWQRDFITITRSKISRQQIFPLEPRVGNAIARYLHHGRPKSKCRDIFLTLHAPYRPLSAGAMYNIVTKCFSQIGAPIKGRGPHGLRHSCARHLLQSGHSFKEIGDLLGHRSPDATRIYAKVDLPSLRLVALENFGGLL